MKTKKDLSKTCSFCSFAVFTALILTVGAYLSQPTFGEEGEIVEVDTVEELYTEFYSKPGATIELVPGIYVLNSAGPNGGRLAFGPQTAAAIKGQNEYFHVDGDGVPDPLDLNMDGEPDLDPAGKIIFTNPTTETIIDASGLILSPTNAFGFIDMRAQPNTSGTSQSVSNITLRGNGTPRAAIFVAGTQNSILDAKISGCIIEDSPRGIQIDARAANPAGQNAQLNVMAEGNVIRNSGSKNLPGGVAFGWGIQTTQISTSGVKFFVNVLHNRFYQNKIGLFLEPQGMQDAMIDVFSQSNVYEKAVLTASARRPGSVLSGGIIIEVLDSASAIGSFHNRIHLISQDDAIWNNEGWAGIYIEGIHRTSTTIPTDFVDNEIDVELLRTRFVKLNDDGTFNGLQNREARVDPGKTVEEQPTLRRDITIVGADNSGTSLRELPPEVLPGSANDNKVKVKIKEAITSVMPTDYDKKPKPFAIYDNAPDQVEVELELEEINYIGSKNK